MRARQSLARATIALALALAARAAVADPLATDDPRALAAAITAIEADPGAGADRELAAARACETELHAPDRALALYDRITREHPSERAALLASRRAAQLRAGGADDRDGRAGQLAHLIASADGLAPDELERRGDALAAASWPGAADAALWVAEWARRSNRLADAQARYAAVAARWPGTPIAVEAIRGGAGCALEAHDWTLAEHLADKLPTADPADLAVRDELRAEVAGGRASSGVYLGAWCVLVLAALALLGSLVATVRTTGRRPAMRPPLEIVLLAPVVAVMIGASFTANSAIAPAVATISLGGLVLGWISGATLELARAAGRPLRTRTLVHIAVVAAGVLALAYIAVMHGGLLDALIETVRYGPD